MFCTRKQPARRAKLCYLPSTWLDVPYVTRLHIDFFPFRWAQAHQEAAEEMQHLFNPQRWPLWPQNHQKQTMLRKPYTVGEIQGSRWRQHPRKPACFDPLSFWLWPPLSGDSRSIKLPETSQEMGSRFPQKQRSKVLWPASYLVSVLSCCLLTFLKSLTMCQPFQNCQAYYNVCRTTAQQIIAIETILRHGWQTRKRSGLTHQGKCKYVNTCRSQSRQSQIIWLQT